MNEKKACCLDGESSEGPDAPGEPLGYPGRGDSGLGMVSPWSPSIKLMGTD